MDDVEYRPLGISERLQAQLLCEIESGQRPPGSRLPSIRQCARQHALSAFTVVEVYDRLVASGHLEARRGAGFYVQPRTRQDTPPLPTLEELPLDENWLLQQVFEQPARMLPAGCGWLPPAWYAEENLSKALRALAREGGPALDYGDPKGYEPLRAHLAQRWQAMGLRATSADIVLTQGASKALDMAACALLQPGDTVLVDDPGYCNLLSCLAFRGFRLIGMPWRQDGPDTDALRELMARHRPRAMFTQSALHNPSGASYSSRAAHQVLKLAEEFGVLVVEDDVCRELTPEHWPTLASLGGLEQVVYIGSFSKTLSPALRVGFVAASPARLERLLRYKMLSGLTTPQLNERLALSLSQSGPHRHQVEQLRRRLAQGQHAVAAKLDALGWQRYCADSQGPFLLARPPREADPLQLASRARDHDIQLSPGQLFRPYGQPSPWLRFNVGYSQDERLWQFLAQSA